MTDKRLQKPPVDIQTESDKVLREAVKRIASTDEGVIFFRYLVDYCGFKQPSTVYHPVTSEVITSALIHNESKRCTWLDIRKLIPKNRLNVIEAER